MATERLHFPFGRSLLDLIFRSELVVALAALFRSLTVRPEDETAIAWEDGEAEDLSEKR
jgi:hypothetical protein